jgi:Protein of unknown function (DUF2971).
MWAHYTSNLTGFVLEFDEMLLMEYLSDSYVEDVNYLSETSPEIRNQLNRAYYVGKPRHAIWLNKAANHIAYFSKHDCWSYEKERRLVVNSDDLDKINENMLMHVPMECVTAIVAGARANEYSFNKSIVLANEIGCKHYDLFIGKSYKQPYFKDSSGHSYVFDGESIVGSESYCDDCKEPLSDSHQELCAWCAIDEVHQHDAMIRNPLRMLNRIGNLEEYIRGFNAVGKK